MTEETRTSKLAAAVDQITRLGGLAERTRIDTNLEVIDATGGIAGAAYIIIEDQEGYNVPAVRLSGVPYTNGDLVNVLYVEGTEPIAFQQGSGSVNPEQGKVSKIWQPDFSDVVGEANNSDLDLLLHGNLDFDNDAADHSIVVAGTSDLLFTTAGGTITFDDSGNLAIPGTLTIPSDMIHAGDADTLLSFGTNQVNVQAGNRASNFDSNGDLNIYGDIYSGDTERGSVEAVAFDFKLHDTANALGITSHFRDNTATYPGGWTEVDAAAYTDTLTNYSSWLLLGTSSDTAWDYQRQTSIDLENDVTPNARITALIGPITWRDAAFTADVNYYLGLYRDNAGSIDGTTYVRIRLRYDNSAGVWKIRGEESDGSVSHTGAEVSLDNGPYHKPLYVAVSLTNSASKTAQAWYGTENDFALHTQLMSQNPTTPPTWGQMWARFTLVRGAGSADRIIIGAIDKQDG